MNAIIIAAGKGARLKHYTEDMPKCMLMVEGKTILERQLEIFRSCGVEDIAVVKGFAADKINYEGLRYYVNDDFANNNILNSLFYAEEFLTGPVIISYSDILFKKRTVEELLCAPGDITVAVDEDWKKGYVDRQDHPVSEAEKVILGGDARVSAIGKHLSDEHPIGGEFIGMMKLSAEGADVFKDCFHRAKQEFWGKPYQRAALFQKAYLTDMIQDLIDSGTAVHAAVIQGGWREIDTVEDYEKFEYEVSV